ncbi:MAG: hypothetical protein NC548_33545 [Lachnospiraceae bacterium]|nr:hypothetical protein [Lachnospiraceae bacterium]MCM1232737.1 hypothetical protein [Ruminococcus flavefaciens]
MKQKLTQLPKAKLYKITINHAEKITIQSLYLYSFDIKKIIEFLNPVFDYTISCENKYKITNKQVTESIKFFTNYFEKLAVDKTTSFYDYFTFALVSHALKQISSSKVRVYTLGDTYYIIFKLTKTKKFTLYKIENGLLQSIKSASNFHVLLQYLIYLSNDEIEKLETL